MSADKHIWTTKWVEDLEAGLCKYQNRVDKYAAIRKDEEFRSLHQLTGTQLTDKGRNVLQKMIKDGHPLDQIGGWIFAVARGSGLILHRGDHQRNQELNADFCEKRRQFLQEDNYPPASPATPVASSSRTVLPPLHPPLLNQLLSRKVQVR
ncbi:hypothetical protein MIR68_008975 [Amoeboaphelidium protococcarum]|nr:hypothetical protein MIR68_008975 [Amoeboaphelidium protococcarum]